MTAPFPTTFDTRVCGESGLLVDFAQWPTPRAAVAAFVDVAGPLLPDTELVPAATTVLCCLPLGGGDLSALTARVQRLHAHLCQQLRRGDAVDESDHEVVTIPVHYDGEDLAEVAELLGIGVREVIHRHTETEWQAAFGGFAPGFMYLLADGDPLTVPRRAQPRTHLPAGAVGLAGEFSGVYPKASPGGWQIIGHTEAVMWDLQRSEPALITPGRRVRFTEV